MSKHYLVTGGLGFLGSAMAKSLVRDGHKVRILDNASRGSIERLSDLKEEMEIIEGDIRDQECVSRALRGIDSVCHFAFINGTENFYTRPVEVLEVGIKGILNILDGCLRAKVRELVLASSSEVYQTPSKIPTDETAALSIPDVFNPRYSYAGGKIISELMAIHCGKQHFERVLIFRPHNVFGPDMGWEHVIPEFVMRLKELKSNLSSRSNEIDFRIQGTGEQTRSFIYVEDFVQALRLIFQKGEHLNIYHVGTSEEITIREVACRVADCMGVKIRVVPGPAAEGGTLRRCPDIKKLQGLGFQPRFCFIDGLKPTVQWYVSNTPILKNLGGIA